MWRTRVRIGLEARIVEARTTFHGTRPFTLSVCTCETKTRCNRTISWWFLFFFSSFFFFQCQLSTRDEDGCLHSRLQDVVVIVIAFLFDSSSEYRKQKCDCCAICFATSCHTARVTESFHPFSLAKPTNMYIRLILITLKKCDVIWIRLAA